jgi:formylglycine-generating enzyme required for sulfatase activity
VGRQSSLVSSAGPVLRRVIRGLAFLTAICVAGALGIAPAAADKRVALVIGVSAYKEVKPLRNPANDAKLISETLRGLGFTLVGGGPQLDLDRNSLSKAVESFGREAPGADIALFYYAGHGVQVKGENYLIPVEADLATEADVHTKLLNVQAVLDHMAKARLKVVILDACRNNPFSTRAVRGGQRGLAAVQAGGGTLIAYATAPNDVAQDGTGHNSPYTQALAEVIRRPGLKIFDIFDTVGVAVLDATKGEQLPWFSASAIGGSFYFVPPSPSQVAAAGPIQGGVSGSPGLTSAPSGAPQSGSPTGAGTVVAALPSNPAGQSAPGKNVPQFKDCDGCPAMVVVPPGRALIGSSGHEAGRSNSEGPQQEISIARPFAVSRSEVSFEEYLGCVAEGGCRPDRPGNYGWGEGKQPVINVSWDDAKAYVAWLSRKTGASYRLLSEAEWEYAARGCTAACPSDPFWFGQEIAPTRANYNWNLSYNGSLKAQPRRRTFPVDAGEPNPFGLLNMHGNVREWTEDCWNTNLAGVPRDGSARTSGDCNSHVVRGGSWADDPRDLRSARRWWEVKGERRAEIGMRIARSCRNEDAATSGKCE